MQDKQAIKQTLEEEARRCQWLVLWLDCDREGENIAYEVIEVCTGANNHLYIWRARFSALIDRYWFVQMVPFPVLQGCITLGLSKKQNETAGKYTNLCNILSDPTNSLQTLWMQDR